MKCVLVAGGQQKVCTICLAAIYSALRRVHCAAGQIESKPKRPEYKFQKKAVRTKGNRGKADDTDSYDGAAFSTGRRGGLVRVPVSK